MVNKTWLLLCTPKVQCESFNTPRFSSLPPDERRQFHCHAMHVPSNMTGVMLKISIAVSVVCDHSSMRSIKVWFHYHPGRSPLNAHYSFARRAWHQVPRLIAVVLMVHQWTVYWKIKKTSCKVATFVPCQVLGYGILSKWVFKSLLIEKV